MTARVLAGTSGYSYKEWRGPFCPATLPSEGMLAWYAQRLPTVEINHTFYRMPSASVLAQWGETVPPHFRFAIKAPRRITHDAHLRADAAADPVAYLYRTLEALGDTRGPVLFQLPPSLRKDVPLLVEFLQTLPQDHRAAFEFRNAGWFSDDVHDALRTVGAALCLSERQDGTPPPLVATAPWGYVRLRLERYSDADLARWAARLVAAPWREVHAYFMHEPAAPGHARMLMRFASSR